MLILHVSMQQRSERWRICRNGWLSFSFARRDMEAAVHRPPDAAMLGEYEDRPTKTARGAAGAARSTARHIETEQRRRDRINEGFKTLRELLPMQEKMDKANFLMSCVAYIRQLQVRHGPPPFLPMSEIKLVEGPTECVFNSGAGWCSSEGAGDAVRSVLHRSAP